MKTLITTLALVLGVSLPAAWAQEVAPRQAGSAQAQAPSFKKLTRAEFDALLADPSKIVIVDVRRPDELQTNGGFGVYLSIQLADLEKSLAFIPKDRSIITVSNNSGRAGRAAALLTTHGFTVAGGIGALEYAAQGGTLVKIAAPAPRAGAGAGAAPAAAASTAGS